MDPFAAPPLLLLADPQLLRCAAGLLAAAAAALLLLRDARRRGILGVTQEGAFARPGLPRRPAGRFLPCHRAAIRFRA